MLEQKKWRGVTLESFGTTIPFQGVGIGKDHIFKKGDSRQCVAYRLVTSFRIFKDVQILV